MMVTQKHLHVRGLTITPTYPDYLRRKAQQHAQVAEISVFGHDYESFPPRMLPNLFIGYLINTERIDMA